jgi:membrane-associated protease RseP (regulator of RpoE activity)
MMEFSLNLVSIIIFYGLIVYLIIKHRKNIEFHKIFFLYKTKTGIKLIDKLAKYRFWKYWAYAGIPVGFIGMIGIFWILLSKVPEILFVGNAEKSVQLLLPGVSGGSMGLFMFMPFWTFIICIVVIVIVHEGAHGIITRVHKLKLESTGIGMFTIIPLAFVEPDEKQLEKSSVLTQLSIFVAGPFANICTAIIVTLISLFLLAPMANIFLESTSVEVTDVKLDFPADLAGISVGDKIFEFNSVQIRDSDVFIEEITKLNPGDSATILLQDREVVVNTINKPGEEESAYVGISFKTNFEPKSDNYFTKTLGNIVLYLIGLFYWLALLNIGIALVNLLPLGPVDGGRMIKTVFNKYLKGNLGKIMWIFISMLALAVLLINIFGPIIF